MLSLQFEQEAKMQSEKKKLASQKRKMELIEKIEIDQKNRSGSEDSHRSIHNNSNGSLMDSIYHMKNPVAEKRQVNLIINLKKTMESVIKKLNINLFFILISIIEKSYINIKTQFKFMYCFL